MHCLLQAVCSVPLPDVLGEEQQEHLHRTKPDADEMQEMLGTVARAPHREVCDVRLVSSGVQTEKEVVAWKS